MGFFTRLLPGLVTFNKLENSEVSGVDNQQNKVERKIFECHDAGVIFELAFHTLHAFHVFH